MANFEAVFDPLGPDGGTDCIKSSSIVLLQDARVWGAELASFWGSQDL